MRKQGAHPAQPGGKCVLKHKHAREAHFARQVCMGAGRQQLSVFRVVARWERSAFTRARARRQRDDIQPNPSQGRWPGSDAVHCMGSLERAKGIEPSYAAWETEPLPPTDAPKFCSPNRNPVCRRAFDDDRRRISCPRTLRRILSPPLRRSSVRPSPKHSRHYAGGTAARP